MPQMQADFQEEKFIHLMTKPIMSAGKVWFQAPDKFRREVKGDSPSVTVGDGQQLWIYYPNFKSAEHYSLGKRSPLDSTTAALLAGLNLQNVESNYRVTASKIDNGYQLDLVPRRPSLKIAFSASLPGKPIQSLVYESLESSRPSGLIRMKTICKAST